MQWARGELGLSSMHSSFRIRNRNQTLLNLLTQSTIVFSRRFKVRRSNELLFTDSALIKLTILFDEIETSTGSELNFLDFCELSSCEISVLFSLLQSIAQLPTRKEKMDGNRWKGIALG